jgi:hypothetical protein
MRVFLIATAAALFAAGPALACVATLESNPVFVEIDVGAGPFRVDLASLRNGSDAKRASELADRLTALGMQKRELRSGIVLDEPSRLSDPGSTLGERNFWCDADGNPTPRDDVAGTHICSQGCIVEDVFWDEIDQIFVFVTRRALDCAGNPDFASCN